MDTDALSRPSAGSPGLMLEDYAGVAPHVFHIEGEPWFRYGRILRPLALPHEAPSADRMHVRQALRRSGCLLACWTEEWDSREESSWWWTICDEQIDSPEGIASARGRRSVRKGLRECEVRRMGYEEFVMLSYPLHAKARVAYGGPRPDEQAYYRMTAEMARWRGTEFWGATCDGNLAAFAICTIVGAAVNITYTKSDVGLSRLQPNAALFYTLTQDYLQRGFAYVTNGWRTLVHPTEINEYLERLGYRKAYGRVQVELSLLARVVAWSRVTRWGRSIGLARLLGDRWQELEGFQALLDISRGRR